MRIGIWLLHETHDLPEEDLMYTATCTACTAHAAHLRLQALAQCTGLTYLPAAWADRMLGQHDLASYVDFHIAQAITDKIGSTDSIEAGIEKSCHGRFYSAVSTSDLNKSTGIHYSHCKAGQIQAARISHSCLCARCTAESLTQQWQSLAEGAKTAFGGPEL